MSRVAADNEKRVLRVGDVDLGVLHLTLLIGDFKNTVRGYCLDIPRFEESPNN